MTAVKVGPKNRHVEVPEGWRRVTQGQCKTGDMFVHLGTLKLTTATHDDVGMNWDDFDFLFRKYTP